ncbi:unnamed protein product, partial [marine sediment metagenome]
AAQFILAVRAEVSPFSPISFGELKQQTQSYRRAQGLEYRIPPPELVEAEIAMKAAKAALNLAEERGLKNEKLAPYLKAMSDAEYRYRQLLVKWEAETK